MRVLQVVPSVASRTGGPATSVVESSLALRRCGVETAVFATDMAEPASAACHRRVSASDLPPGAEGLDIRIFPACRPYRLAFSPSLYRALEGEVSEYDVVHIHSLYLFPQFAAHRLATCHGVPYVVSPRGSLDPYLRRRGRLRKAAADLIWQRNLLGGAAFLHLTSEEEARLVDDVAPLVSRIVIPNGIRWSDYQDLPAPDQFRKRYLAGEDGPILMNLGRMSHKKGLDILVRAFSLVVAEVPQCWLVVVGPDDEGLTPHLRALAEREGVASRVVFTGILRGEDKLAALAAADIWALPSHTENFGNAVMEALAAGLAAVVSPAVNIAPDIDAAAAGVVCEQTPQAFASEIIGLLRNEDRRSGLGCKAREFAKRYDWAAVGPRLAEMYAQAAQKR